MDLRTLYSSRRARQPAPPCDVNRTDHQLPDKRNDHPNTPVVSRRRRALPSPPDLLWAQPYHFRELQGQLSDLNAAQGSFLANAEYAQPLGEQCHDWSPASSGSRSSQPRVKGERGAANRRDSKRTCIRWKEKVEARGPSAPIGRVLAVSRGTSSPNVNHHSDNSSSYRT